MSFGLIRAMGFRKSLKFLYTTVLHIGYQAMILPQLRVAYLRMCGAEIGSDTIICDGVRLINLHRRGFKALKIGRGCWVSRLGPP